MRPESSLALRLVLAAACAACAGKDIQLGHGALDAAEDAAADASPPGRRRARRRDPVDGSASAETLPRFTEPMPIEGIATADSTDDDPSLTADLTQLYFNSIRDGTLGRGRGHLVQHARGRRAAAWGAPVPASALNTEQRETGIALAADGLSILWSSDRPGRRGRTRHLHGHARAARRGVVRRRRACPSSARRATT